MSTTQDFIPFSDIQKDLVFLNDGSVTAVLRTSAVNFGLLSEVEQVSIIESFAGLLNSLSFPIQIVIHSQRLDVSSYLTLLDKALKNQTNPLLASLIPRYRAFVEKMIKENDVLDKEFYIAMNVSAPELGLVGQSLEDRLKKSTTILTPRIDHLMRQLGRIGLKAERLNSEALVRLFYRAYNEKVEMIERATHFQVPPQTRPAAPTVQPPMPTTPSFSIPRPQASMPTANQFPAAISATPSPAPAAAPAPVIPNPTITNLTPPFVVEELTDDFRT